MSVTSFATADDYEARYGPPDDRARVAVMLADASALIAAQPGFERDDADEVQAANLVRVACAVVYRALSAGDLAGLSSYSQGAGGYTASVSLANPSGDMYLTAAERRALGVGCARVGCAPVYAGASGGVA